MPQSVIKMSANKTKSIQLSPDTIAEVRNAVFALAEKALPEAFYLVVDFEKESGHWYLRLYIDKADQQSKVSLENCEVASRAIDPELESIKHLKDFPYTLEVSSPGAFRPIATGREFVFYAGRNIKIERPDRANSKRVEVISGTLVGHTSNSITLGINGQSETIELNPHTQIYLNPDIRLPEDEGSEGAEVDTEAESVFEETSE